MTPNRPDKTGFQRDSDLPRLAVLVLTYNHEPYIEACLRSILQCDFPNMHVWVLDDGSSDNTASIVSRISKLSERVTFISQAQSGGRTGANTQRLIRESTSEFVALMSGDDMLGPGFPMADTVAAFQADPALDLCIPRAVPFMQDPSQVAPTIYTPEFLAALRSNDASVLLRDHLHKTVSRVFLQGVVIRRTAIDATGGFDTDLVADDYAFIMKLIGYLKTTGRRYRYMEDSLWLYRNHGQNIHRNALRQFRLINEVVARYVPPGRWPNFGWDAMAFENYDELMNGRSEARKLFGHAAAKSLLNKVYRLTLRHARKQQNLLLLERAIVDRDADMRQRLSALVKWCQVKASLQRHIAG